MKAVEDMSLDLRSSDPKVNDLEEYIKMYVRSIVISLW